MDNALYIVLSRQTGLFRQMDVIANNVANADTVGYKSEDMVFTNYVRDAGRGREVDYTQDIGMARDLSEGGIRLTDRPFDVAIKGDGYFVIDTPVGPRYTRAGNFVRNPDGQLVNSDGYPVQGLGGAPIVFAEGDSEVVIGQDGSVQARVDGALEARGQIGVVTFEDERALQKVSDTQFPTNQDPQPAFVNDDFQIIQGALEGSNVNAINQMTQMIQVSRRVGSTARFMNDIHEMQRTAITTLSRQSN